MLSKVIALLQAKALVTAAAAVLLVGGASAAFAATPQGQSLMKNVTRHAPPTMTVGHDGTPGAKGTSEAKKGNNGCPGLPDAQNLAARFHLSTASSGSTVQAICALHNGTFKGTTASGTTVSAQHVLGYGEIEQLLTLAQFMAAHDATNAGAKLTDTNVSSFLAAALHICASTHSTEDCVRDNTSSNNGNGNGNGNGNNPGTGKPTSTPTPPPHH